MPRLNINYENTVIYKIVCNDLNVIDCYVGSTTDFTKRKSCHKSTCNKETAKGYYLKVYKMIRDNGGWENWTMLVVEKYPCLDIHEATLRERHWYELLNATLNSINPNRSKEEYTLINKDKTRMYQLVNKDKIVEGGKEYYLINRDKIIKDRKQYRDDNKDKLKITSQEYRNNNKETINERSKAYTLLNKDKINKANNERYKKTLKQIEIK